MHRTNKKIKILFFALQLERGRLNNNPSFLPHCPEMVENIVHGLNLPNNHESNNHNYRF